MNIILKDILVLLIMALFFISNLILINKYRKSAIKTYEYITKNDKVSNDSLFDTEKTAQRIREQLYNIEKDIIRIKEKNKNEL